MPTKEKIIAAIQAMPETEFGDIDVLLERIVDLTIKEPENSMAGNYFTIKELQAKIDSWFKK